MDRQKQIKAGLLAMKEDLDELGESIEKVRHNGTRSILKSELLEKRRALEVLDKHYVAREAQQAKAAANGNGAPASGAAV